MEENWEDPGEKAMVFYTVHTKMFTEPFTDFFFFLNATFGFIVSSTFIAAVGEL